MQTIQCEVTIPQIHAILYNVPNNPKETSTSKRVEQGTP